VPGSARVKRAILIVVVLVAAVIGSGLWYFRSTNTRLTGLPIVLPVIGDGIARTQLPKRPRAIVVIIEENKSAKEINGDADSSQYIHTLAGRSAVMTHSNGIAHPSQPNYFALFAGVNDTNGDTCPAVGVAPDAPNLGAELIAAHRTFRAYSEDQPSPGFTGCTAGQYARKHAPWTNFTNIPRASWVPFSDLHAYEELPDVAFIVPNLVHDMHSASIEDGDTWLHAHVDPLIAWANAHDALVILTWDESSSPRTNHIPTFFIGPMVRPGRYDEPISHYNVLRTIEDLEGTAHAGHAATSAPILDIWRK